MAADLDSLSVTYLQINITGQDRSSECVAHHHRSEHWVVVKGTEEVIIGDNIQMLCESESVYIPLGEVHRLAG
jgi:mannose-6-phosphate isomerase-like protein (cupin superfamily)